MEQHNLYYNVWEVLLEGEYLTYWSLFRLMQCNKYLKGHVVKFIHKLPSKYELVDRLSLMITDDVLKQLPFLKHLNVRHMVGITNEGIKHLNLSYLDISLKEGPEITGNGIRHMALHTLRAYGNRFIQDEDIQDMTSLKILDIGGHDSKITDQGLKKLYLDELYAEDNKRISDEGIKHMNLKFIRAKRSGISKTTLDKLDPTKQLLEALEKTALFGFNGQLFPVTPTPTISRLVGIDFVALKDMYANEIDNFLSAEETVD